MIELLIYMASNFGKDAFMSIMPIYLLVSTVFVLWFLRSWLFKGKGL